MTGDTAPGSAACVSVKNADIMLTPDNKRVIMRAHVPFNELRAERIISRVLFLDETNVQKELKDVLDKFMRRHRDFEAILERHFNLVRPFMPSDISLSRERRLLIGSLFSAEYSFESAALFNPSIVAHPDQSGLPGGHLRFIMSLRARGMFHP